MPLRVAIIYGSVRTQRRGIGLAKWLVEVVAARGHVATLVDAKEADLPMLDRMYKEFEPGTAPPQMERIHHELEAADAFVVVSGEYNHSVPPALKNLLDHYQQEYYLKPAGIVTYSKGAFGGARVGPHVRAILGELGMYTLSTIFAVSRVGDAFAPDGKMLDDAYARRVKPFLDELEWLGDALAAKRASGPGPF